MQPESPPAEAHSTGELPTTEQRNPDSTRLDEMGTEEILRLINAEDRKVPDAVEKALPRIAEAVEIMVEAWGEGGRWIYVGAGTSGRIAPLDAAECPPTFGVSPDRVVALVAGGDTATTRAVENAEDDQEVAKRDLDALGLRAKDVVIGLAASGSTPYVVSAVRHAAGAGCATIGISNNEGTKLSEEARVAIELPTGPEVLTGSTRLKAGTSQKLVSNMLSTAAFTRLGKTYENLMVDMQAKNDKLEHRSRRIVSEAAGVSEARAEDLLVAADGSVKVAVVMGKTALPASAARALLNEAHGNVRLAMEAAEGWRSRRTVAYLCVDGGQTKTAVVLRDEGGGEIEAWRDAPLTTPAKPGAMDNLRAVVRGIAEELGHRTQKSSLDPPEAACFSLTGYMEGDAIPSVIRAEIQESVPGVGRIHVVPDYFGNWAAATGGEPGVMVISGGGSVAYGRTGSGEAPRIGGWGHVLGDEGSGFWIGLEAIKAALKSRAGVVSETALGERIMREFGTQDDHQVVREVYSASISEAEIAGLVPLVASLSQEGDATATRILDEAAGHLADIVRAVLRQLGDLAVYPSGGVFRAPTMRERFEEALKRSGNDVEVKDTVSADPLDGVFLIARRGIR